MARRPKRFFEGGMDEKEPGWESKEAPVASESPTNFKSAFAAARSAGDKTFEFGGKKYTTELAGSKPAPKTESEPETKSTSSEKSVVFKKETPKEPTKAVTSSSFDPDSINFGGTKVEPKKEPAERKYTQTRGGRLYDDERTKKSSSSGTSLFGGFSGSQRNPKKMAKGGTASSRADGIAQRGKTRGTIASMCGGGMSRGKR